MKKTNIKHNTPPVLNWLTWLPNNWQGKHLKARNFLLRKNLSNICWRELSQKYKCGYYDRATPESFFIFMYYAPILKAWKFPKGPVEVLCDITPHLVAYRTAVETRTKSSGMRAHTGQHSGLPCLHTPLFALLVDVAYRNCAETDNVTAHLRCSKATLHRLLEGFSFPNLPNILGNNLSISTSIPGRLISESKIWWEFPFNPLLS